MSKRQRKINAALREIALAERLLQSAKTYIESLHSKDDGGDVDGGGSDG